MNEITYYAAYGSNLNKLQMQSRCPMAKPIGKAVLRGWQLVFRGVADIMPCQEAQVNLGIYSITPECEIALDHYESFPNLYIKRYIPIRLELSQITSMFYIMRPGYGFGEHINAFINDTASAFYPLASRASIFRIRPIHVYIVLAIKIELVINAICHHSAHDPRANPFK